MVLAKINVPANAEVGLVATTTGAAHGDGKRLMEFRFPFDIPHVPYTSWNDCLQKGACGEDC